MGRRRSPRGDVRREVGCQGPASRSPRFHMGHGVDATRRENSRRVRSDYKVAFDMLVGHQVELSCK